MSNIFAASFIFFVRRTSDALGCKFPVGWLCAITKAVAPTSNARFKTKRTSTVVAAISPY